MKRIRVKLKIWMLWKNITIAFRPVYLIAFSFSLMIVFDAVMIAIMSFYSDADLIYKICSNLILGSTASFIVAIIIEMAHNYQINRRKDLELNEFYGSLYSFLSDRIFEMGLSDNSLLQHYSKEPLEDCVARPGEIPKEGQMAPKDEIQVLWDHFSEIIKSCQDTYKQKRISVAHGVKCSYGYIEFLLDVYKEVSQIRCFGRIDWVKTGSGRQLSAKTMDPFKYASVFIERIQGRHA